MKSYYKPKSPLLQKYIETDNLRKQTYDACCTGNHNYKELSEITGYTVSKLKNIMIYLLEKEYVTQERIYTKDIKRSILRITATNKVYEKRTLDKLKADINERYEKRSEPLVAGKFDALIAKNPALRKVCLFDEKDNDYFKIPLKKSKHNGIGSTFSMYDTATL